MLSMPPPPLLLLLLLSITACRIQS